MPKIRLFFDKTLEEKKELEIIGEEFHYLCNVMRCNLGSVISLFNGKDGEFTCELISKEKKKIILKVLKRAEYLKINNHFELAFCPPKSQRLDFLIQKCTELGVKSFSPVISDHTLNRKINLDRIKKIIKEAVEQSNQIYIPEINEPTSFDKYTSNNKKIFFADIQSETKFSDLKSRCDSLNSSIFIGPEGDFSSKEINILRERKNCISFSLGPRILRSETAAIASLVLFNNLKN